ncbi:MAG: DegT/DnrJ/EryC1/StrS family aminotransferase [Candidatus Thiodiazotropha sp.]
MVPLKKMMLYQQPPVGNLISLSKSKSDINSLFNPYKVRYYRSGTVSLAAAIKTAITLNNTPKPEVILPAYGCPDILSAVIFSGAKPVFIDFEENKPWMNITQVENKISKSTVAIICVNFLGIQERTEIIRNIAKDRGVMTIEDSAQAMPICNDDKLWKGDIVVISFGRGKPVNLLGGGALLYKAESIDTSLDPSIPTTKTSFLNRTIYRFKVAIYNKIINPRLYVYLQYLPFLGIGTTEFKPIEYIEGFDDYRLSILAENLHTYCNNSVDIQLALSKIIDEHRENNNSILDLPTECSHNLNHALLRYPLLIDSSSREALYSELNAQGLGPSKLYPTVMPNYLPEDMQQLNRNEYPCANDFASRILTLPTHQGLSSEDINRMRKIISPTR